MTITAVDILDEAIKNWQTKGWIQHGSRNNAGATCSAGGIEWAAMAQMGYFSSTAPVPFSLQREFERATLAFREAIEDRNGKSIIFWNDEPSRTVEDVILTAKRAIEKLEALKVER